ncbi:MAG TPA: DUF3617 family protein [Steroidobacteraceae bacterium]|nr:DUF3617 family protein [Steroidobacteraceae bacterium]
MRIILMMGAVIGAAAIAGADEVQPPLVKEGLWEASSQHTMFGRTMHTSMKICQTHETQRKEREFAAGIRKQNQCTSQSSQPAPGVYVSESRCASGPAAGTVTRSTTTFQGDGSYRSEIHMTIAGKENVTILEAKYVGPCPPDMKPGDTLMPDGRKINVTGG